MQKGIYFSSKGRDFQVFTRFSTIHIFAFTVVPQLILYAKYFLKYFNALVNIALEFSEWSKRSIQTSGWSDDG